MGWEGHHAAWQLRAPPKPSLSSDCTSVRVPEESGAVISTGGNDSPVLQNWLLVRVAQDFGPPTAKHIVVAR